MEVKHAVWIQLAGKVWELLGFATDGTELRQFVRTLLKWFITRSALVGSISGVSEVALAWRSGRGPDGIYHVLDKRRK
jgi:hypothetical protein